MFQESALTGALFMAGILVGSLGWGSQGHIAVFVGAVAALVLASAVGYVLKLTGLQAGLWGFNGILAGCAAYTFLSLTLPISIFAGCIILTIPLKLILDKAFRFTSISSLTFPFIVATWLLLYVAKSTGIPPFQPQSIAEIHEITPAALLTGWLKGVSEVFLIDSWIAGLLFLVGLWLSSRQAAIWAAVGSAAGICFAIAAGCPANDIQLGLWGYSPALTAIAVGVVFRPACTRNALWVMVTLCAVILTGVFQKLLLALLSPIELPVLTLPFCLATWLVMLAVKSSTRPPENSIDL